MKKLPPQKQLKSVFQYCKHSGKLFWKKSVSRKCVVGKEAGSTVPVSGALRVGLFGCDYLVHRIIWKMHYGTEPPMIDHIDGNPKNNRIENLRKATASINNKNKRRDKRSKTGISGIYFNKNTQNYHARYSVNGKRVHVGYFPTLEEAKKQLNKARKNNGYTERHGI
ncbi:MAG: HNH endonuclease signature motif containing protein [Candidatus Puniceispirillaceae bacterium]